ncbi:MAG: apolipoprotein N-acyltransferase [Acidobacteriota bacterium]
MPSVTAKSSTAPETLRRLKEVLRQTSARLSNLSPKNRFGLSALAGGLNILLFPVFSVNGLAWISLVPFLLSLHGEQRARRSLLYGFIAGSIFFLGSCYWIAIVLKKYGDLSWPTALLLLIVLTAFLSFFFALFGLVFSYLSNRFPRGCFLLAPFVWVGTEYLRAHALTGFPWCLQGYALVDYSSISKVVAWTGVYGLSWIVLAGNCILVLLLTGRQGQVLYTLLILMGVLTLWPRFGDQGDSERIRPKNVRLVQPNISLDQEWSPTSKEQLLDDLQDLSLQSDRSQTSSVEPVSLLVWPETPAPFYLNHDREFRRRMQSLARASDAYLVFGFVDFRVSKSAGAEPEEPSPFNSVAVLSPSGEFVSQYDKIHLVPFGEYIPYPSVFFFVDKISTEAGNFSPGNHLVVSQLDGAERLGTFICYESIIPDLVRKFTAAGAQLLVNVTNDGWFGDSPAPYQHLSMARLRAIENHRYLIRAANSGISAVIDPEGRILVSTRLNQRTVLEGTVKLYDDLTFYAKHGDLFAFSCVGASLAGLVLAWRRRRQGDVLDS